MRADLSRFNRWTPDDRRWLRLSFSPGPERKAGRLDLSIGKFNAGQKLNAVFVGAAIVVMLATGVVMHWFSPWPLSWRTGATFVHQWLAIAVVVVVLGHITYALTKPGGSAFHVQRHHLPALGAAARPRLGRGNRLSCPRSARRSWRKDKRMTPEVVRRVITGQRSNGESVFTHVQEIEPLRRQDGTPLWWCIWGFDELPVLPYLDDQPYIVPSLFPPAGAVRVQMVNIPPGNRKTVARPPDKWFELRAAVDVGYDRDESTGMHTTDTVDVGIVISGECEIEQGNGERVRLRVGDVYVQNGAEHAWHNDFAEPFIIVFVFLGVERRPGFPKRTTS